MGEHTFIVFVILKRGVIAAIRLYQRTLSLDHGPLRHLFPYGTCRYIPTCSEYAIQAVDEHGIIRGVAMGLRRIGRCNPWNNGGIDPVPKRK